MPNNPREKLWKIDRFYGGFAVSDKLGLPHQFADTSRNLDIYTDPGLLRPQKLMEDDETGATAADISDYWAASDDKIYAIGMIGGGDSKTRLYVKADINGDWATAASDGDGTYVNSRLWEYKDYIYFWTKADTLARYGPLSGAAAFDDAINSITVSGSEADKPFIEQKGTLYAAYDNKLASYDGTTHTDSALDLADDWEIVSLAVWGKYIAIGAYLDSGYQKISRMFFWDTSATSWEFAKNLPQGQLMGIRSVGDRIVGLVHNAAPESSEQGTLAIFEWAGGEAQIVKRISKTNLSLTGNNSLNDAEIDVKEGVFYFAADLKGDYHGLYSWGEPIPGAGKSFTFDRHLRATANTVSRVRAIKFIGSYLFCALTDTSSGTDYVLAKTINAVQHGTSTSDGGIYDSLIFDGGNPYQTKQLNRIILNAKALPTNTSITLKYKVDRASSWTTIGTWTTAAEKQKQFVDVSGVAFDTFNELQLEVDIKTTAASTGTPEITDIAVFYEDLEIKA